MSSFSVLSTSFVNDSPMNEFVHWKENLLEDTLTVSKSKLGVTTVVLVWVGPHSQLQMTPLDSTLSGRLLALASRPT